MWNSQNHTTMLIVFGALRKYISIIRNDLAAFQDDPERSEELDESIRLTRTIRSASSLVGSFALNRLAAQQEQILESIAAQPGAPPDEALHVVRAVLDAIDAYARRAEAQGEDGSPVSAVDCEELVTAVLACRRFHDLSEEQDEEAIISMFSAPHALVLSDGMQNPSSGPAAPPPPAAKAAGEPQEIPPELWEVFREEASDHIERIYSSLRQLDEEPGNRELVQVVRRSAHTLKGAAGAVGLDTVTQLSHRMEDLLDALYEGQKQVDPDLLRLLASTTDLLHDLFIGKDDPDQEQKLQDIYAAYAARCGVAAAQGAPQTGAGRAAAEAGARSEATTPGGRRAAGETGGQGTGHVRVSASRLHGLRRAVGELIVNRTSLEQSVGRIQLRLIELGPALESIRELCRDIECHRETSPRESCGATTMAELHQFAGGGVASGEAGYRAEFDELEFDRFTRADLWSQSLTEVATSLASARHDLESLVDDCEALLAQQSRLTLETQDRLFRMQMVPLSTILPRLHRALRELATRESKAVQLVVDGDDVELEKTVLEEMVEPLMHLLRNAVDHGIEPAAERRDLEKPETATVRISLAHFGAQVVLQVSDDGRGLDDRKILSRVVDRGLVDAREADSLTSQELYRHIFLPGFSTAESISEISGRGVGMDVVMNKIEQLKGRIDVESTPGKGTSFTIRLPVSLAVTRALILSVAAELYAIPQQAVHSIMRVERNAAEECKGTQWIEVEGIDYPLVRLRDYLSLDQRREPKGSTLLVAIVGTNTHRIALQVDGILPGRDIVVQPLDNHIAAAAGLFGATILGDGRVVPILDPTDLIAGTDANPQLSSGSSADACGWHPPSVMIVDDSISVRRVLVNVIENAGWMPVTARDGVDALETLVSLEYPPDVFLLDVEMPRMDGFELLHTLRQEQAFTDVPIIMITSRAGDKHRQQAFELGATAYITKPFQEDLLMDTIRQHLG